MCPNNPIGTIDLYMVSHHGTDPSGSPQLVHALAPRVAVMQNGTRKGAGTQAMPTMRTSPGLEDIWQLHWGYGAGIEQNSAGVFIANVDDNQTIANALTAPPRGGGPGGGAARAGVRQARAVRRRTRCAGCRCSAAGTAPQARAAASRCAAERAAADAARRRSAAGRPGRRPRRRRRRRTCRPTGSRSSRSRTDRSRCRTAATATAKTYAAHPRAALTGASNVWDLDLGFRRIAK